MGQKHFHFHKWLTRKVPLSCSSCHLLGFFFPNSTIELPISQDLKVKCRSGDYLLQRNFTLVCQQPKTLSLLQRVVDNQASPEMFLLSLPQLLFSNLALFLSANCLRRGSASNLGQNLGENLKSRISPLRIWCKATLLNADGGVTCSPLLYHHCVLEPEEISNNKLSN